VIVAVSMPIAASSAFLGTTMRFAAVIQLAGEALPPDFKPLAPLGPASSRTLAMSVAGTAIGARLQLFFRCSLRAPRRRFRFLALV